MTTIAEISIPASDLALAETLEALPDVEVRVKSTVAEGPLQTMPLVWFAGVERARLDAALDADGSVDEYTRLLEDGDTEEALYRLEYASWVTEVCGTIFEHDGTILDAQCTTGRWTLRLLFPEHDSLSAAVDSLDERDVSVDLKRMVEAGRDTDLETATTLTDAQEEAITEAYRRGYYDVPREVSLEELADGLGISHQALSERLRRANKVLASEQLDEQRAAAQ